MLGRIVRSQRGAYMVFFAILVPFFLGMIGFAVDAGFLYMQKAKMQDIADAAALAGAARLNDGSDRAGNVKSAVRAYADANGIKVSGTGILELSAENTMSPQQDKPNIAQGILTGVMDKDNVQRDHVRVVIAKRVPTFFINLLFPEEKDGVLVKAAAEAEYVEGEAPVVSGDGAVIMTGVFECDFYGPSNIILSKSNYFPVYAGGSDIDPAKLPGTGIIYANSLKGGYQPTYDRESRKLIWTPPLPNGRDFIPDNGYSSYGDPEAKDLAEAQLKQATKMNNKFDNLKNKAKDESLAIKNNLADYIDGKDDKRFIGFYNGQCINNIRSTDTKIDLYMNGTYAEYFASSWGEQAKSQSILTNRQLKNVTKVNSLLFNTSGVIATEGIEYGKVFTVYKEGWDVPGLNISGRENKFLDTIYSAGQIWLGGYDNSLLSSELALLCNSTLHVGLWKSYAERVEKTYHHYDSELNQNVFVDGIAFDQETWIDAKNNSDWHIYFGGSSSGSGSSGSDTETKAHVRLVK